jgi:hypothetical protein
MGGTDDPSNLIELSVEEHAEAHKKLYEEHGNELDKIAYEALSGMIGQEEVIKKVLSESGKNMWSEEDRERMSRERTGRKCNISEESREKMREAGKKNKGRKRPDLAERNKQRKGLNIPRDENGRFV